MQTLFARALRGNMAIYHCSVKTISRSAGKSAVASAAYRAGDKITDERTGEIHDYTRKQGVEHTEIIAPFGVKLDRQKLWNAAESAEKRKNSTVAREYEVALPSELTQRQRIQLARDFARHLVKRYGVVADIAIHEPGREGDQRNHHAHILTTTRKVTKDGFGEKTRSLDDKKTGEISHVRKEWEEYSNRALRQAGHEERICHKTLKAQGVERPPTVHLGPAATAMERRGEITERGELNREAVARGKMESELSFTIEKADIQEKAKQWSKSWKQHVDEWIKEQVIEERRREIEKREQQKEMAQSPKQRDIDRGDFER